MKGCGVWGTAIKLHFRVMIVELVMIRNTLSDTATTTAFPPSLSACYEPPQLDLCLVTKAVQPLTGKWLEMVMNLLLNWQRMPLSQGHDARETEVHCHDQDD